MVGWNVAVTQLVADRVIHKISALVHFYFCNYITANDYNEHVECLFEHMLVSAVYDD